MLFEMGLITDFGKNNTERNEISFFYDELSTAYKLPHIPSTDFLKKPCKALLFSIKNLIKNLIDYFIKKENAQKESPLHERG